MGLREDMDELERHIANRTGKEYLMGTAPPMPQEPEPSDPSARAGLDQYTWVTLRGD